MTTETRPKTQTVWELDREHTVIQFTVKNLVVSTVKGRFTEFQGFIVGSLDNPTDARVEVTIEASSIDTGNTMRDDHLRSSDFLDVKEYPTITFKSTRIEQTSNEHFRVWGDLTIRDVTKEVELEATIDSVGTTSDGQEFVEISVTGTLSRKQWGVKWNVVFETGGVLIGDTVHVDTEVEAIKRATIPT